MTCSHMGAGVKLEIKKPRESFPVTVLQWTNLMQLARDGINVVLVPLSISAPKEHVFQMTSLMKSDSTPLPNVLIVNSTQTNVL